MGNDCDDVRDELLRLTCGETGDPSAALSFHLENCTTCREVLDGSREMVDALRMALQPEPLPERLEADIRTRLDGQTVERHAAWPLRLCAIGTAAAACLLIGLVIHNNATRQAEPSPASVPQFELSGDDAAAIVAACSLLGWDSPVEYSTGVLSERVEDMTRTVTRDPAGRTILPWGPEEDWDLPAGDRGSSAIRSPALCLMMDVRLVGIPNS